MERVKHHKTVSPSGPYVINEYFFVNTYTRIKRSKNIFLNWIAWNMDSGNTQPVCEYNNLLLLGQTVYKSAVLIDALIIVKKTDIIGPYIIRRAITND